MEEEAAGDWKGGQEKHHSKLELDAHALLQEEKKRRQHRLCRNEMATTHFGFEAVAPHQVLSGSYNGGAGHLSYCRVRVSACRTRSEGLAAGAP